MRLLYLLDRKNYDPDGEFFARSAVRGIHIQNGKILMVHSLRYGYYKFPGGGMEPGEDLLTALCREVSEEAGLTVIPASVREYGVVCQRQRGDSEPIFLQHSCYYRFEAEKTAHAQHLDDYEAEAEFMPVWVDPREAIRANREDDHGKTDQVMLEREALVLEKLLEEGCF